MRHRKGLHRLDLALAVDEGAIEATGEVALCVDLVGGADPAVHAQHPCQRLDHAVASCADDEGCATGVLVGVDLVEHLREDPRQDLRHHLRPHAVDRLCRHAGDQLAGNAQYLGGALIGGAAQAVAQVLHPQLASSRLLTIPCRVATRANCIPLDPAIRVLSRSKKAAARLTG